jgi:hypothetical protein
MTFRDYVEQGYGQHSFALYRAMNRIENAASDLYKINGTSLASADDVQRRLRVAVAFIKDAIKILDKWTEPKYVKLRVREDRGIETIYDHLASMVFEVIFLASKVRSPQDLCWWIQHNFVWGEFFGFHECDGVAGRIVKFKVRRLIYDSVRQMDTFPNFKGASILGFCLNVMGLTVGVDDYHRDSRALHTAVLSWTRKNYATLRSTNPRVAEACLVDGLAYDEENVRLVRTFPTHGLGRDEPKRDYFSVDPAPRKSGEIANREAPAVITRGNTTLREIAKSIIDRIWRALGDA